MYICSMQSELIKGTLSVLILKLLKEHKKMYGYQITQMLKEQSNGELMVKEGSLYPALFKLKDDELVETEEEMIGKRVRRYYRLTPKGEIETQRRITEIHSFISLLQTLFK